MTDHATLSASGSHRWIACPGSIRMESGIEDTTSVHAAEGTAAHELAERCLMFDSVNAGDYIGEEFNGFVVDDEMAEYVQQYLDFVRIKHGLLFIEQRVDYSETAPGGFGTADAVIIKDGHVNIVDLKYGKGVKVDAHENSQLKLYALGVYYEFSFLYDIKKFTLNIVQPRLDHIDEFEIELSELLEWAERVSVQARLALTDDAPLRPGETQCRWCKAKSFCKARADDHLSVIYGRFELAETEEPVDPNVLTSDELAMILSNKKDLKRWIDDVESYATQQLLSGEQIPGFKLVRTNSHRKWADEESAGKALTRKMKKSGAYVQKLISVAQAEKILGKESKIIRNHAVKPEGAIVIAPEDDKRSPVSYDIESRFDITDEAA